MSLSVPMNSSMEEDDPRSIKIRKGYNRLHEYFYILRDTNKYYRDEDLEIFDDIFLSFLKEEDFYTCADAMQLLFQKIEYYWLEKANCKIAFNIGKLFDCFLTKFKHQLTESELMNQNLHKIVSRISSDSFRLEKLNDTDYVISVVFLKHYHPDLYEQELDEILRRLRTNEGTDSCVKTLIEDVYPYPNEDLKELMYFQLRSFVLIRNTMMVTEDFIDKSLNVILSGNYRESWVIIYASKMLSHVIVPFISFKQNKINLDKVQIDDKLLLEWLLVFSEKSFGQKIRQDKWESVNEEDFALTWDFVRENATKMQRKIFYMYLIENGFEFHLTDPHSNICFKNVTSK